MISLIWFSVQFSVSVFSFSFHISFFRTIYIVLEWNILPKFLLLSFLHKTFSRIHIINVVLRFHFNMLCPNHMLLCTNFINIPKYPLRSSLRHAFQYITCFEYTINPTYQIISKQKPSFGNGYEFQYRHKIYCIVKESAMPKQRPTTYLCSNAIITTPQRWRNSVSACRPTMPFILWKCDSMSIVIKCELVELVFDLGILYVRSLVCSISWFGTRFISLRWMNIIKVSWAKNDGPTVQVQTHIYIYIHFSCFGAKRGNNETWDWYLARMSVVGCVLNNAKVNKTLIGICANWNWLLVCVADVSFKLWILISFRTNYMSREC